MSAVKPRFATIAGLVVSTLCLGSPGALRNDAVAQSSGPTLGGTPPAPLPLFPPTHWWNVDISQAPVDPSSASFITFIGTTRRLHPDFGGEASPGSVDIYGFPYILVSGSQPKKAVQFQYSDESDGVNHATDQSFAFYPIPDEAITQPHWVEGGARGNVDLRNDSDRHILIVDTENRHLYELYNVYYDGATWRAGSGAFFDMRTDNRRPDGWTSADAAGLAIFPGLVRYDEVFSSAEIRHAFRVTVRSTNGYVYPASHRAGSTSGALPMGARLRLKASKDISGFSPEMQRIFRAMKTYGLIVADNGSDMYISGSFDTRWNNDVLNPAFHALTASDFEVVRLGYRGASTPPTITAPASGAVVGVSGVSFNWNAVSGAAGYDLRIFDSANWATVFSGSLASASSTSALASLSAGRYLFAVRACASSPFSDQTCSHFASVDFRVSPIAPTGTPAITSPAGGANLTASTQTLAWSSVTPDPALPTMSYEVVLTDVQRGITALQINVPHPQTSTIFSLRSSTSYQLRVRACQAACGPFGAPVNFSVTLGAVPSAAPAVNAPSITGGNQLQVSWNAVSGADLYQIQVVQAGAGPGGGALTVAARQVSATSVTLPVPSGSATILVSACNGDGCGPASSGTSVNPAGPNPSQPNLGTPMAGTVVAGPTVLFTWNRLPGDNGANTTYRLFVQDLSRQAPALDVYTRSNFYGAYFKAEGARYDAVVIANPGLSTQATGPAVGFNVSGTSSTAPTMVQPAHGDPASLNSFAQTNAQLSWSPVSGATLYEYFVAIQGQGDATARGVTPGLYVQVPLTAVNGQLTVYSGIVRACPAGAACVPGNDAGWGPWSNQAGPGVTNFTVTTP